MPAAGFASDDWYDVWFPNLAPSVETMKLGQGAETEAAWAKFTKKYHAKMSKPEVSRILDVLAALSRTANFAVGCYCEEKAHCHRSLLRKLLVERGALVA